MKKTKYWVTFYSPGSFVANTWNKNVSEGTQPRDIDWPDNAYAFELYSRVDIHEGEDVFKGDSKQLGATFYHPDSYLNTQSQVEQGSILHRNMKNNDWAKVIWNRWGNQAYPYRPGETVIL